MMKVVTRFAPSPTGPLHLGHVAAARYARDHGERFLVRIEDIDPGRCRPAFTEAILEDLAWLGLHGDGPVRLQSAHLPDYAAVLQRLRDRGLLYPCFCTRADILREVSLAGHAPHAPDGAPLYPGTCRGRSASERAARIAAGEPHAWRLDMGGATACTGPLSFHEAGQGRLACDPASFGDVVLGRKDTPSSYHLCVTHDDALQGVTLVTRGQDLLPATAVHRLLQALLGWPEPGYSHHGLLLGSDGRRLAKRDGALAVAALREGGMTAAEVLRRAEIAPAAN